MKKILLIMCLMFLLCGCNQNSDINKLMSENEYVIIDVRTEEEYKESHLVGAINIPYDEIGQSIGIDKDKLVFVYCMSGKRSDIAFRELNNLGYNVYNLGAFVEIDLPKE